MKEKVTVEEALRKGNWKLKHLPMIVTFSFIGVGFILFNINVFDEWIIPVGFISGFLSGWLVWSYFVIEWKIWAFENVRNVHTLQRKAVEEKLIWEKGSWFEKTEFKNYNQKQKLKHLETKFLEKDIFNDDISVSEETIIFYSKTSITFLLIIYIAVCILGAFLIFIKEYFGLLLIALGIYLIYDSIKKLLDNVPQIIINDEGIQLKGEEFVSWKNIHDDRVFRDLNRKNSKEYLAFNDEMIEINELTINIEELENLLHVYRVRYENNL